MASTLYFKASWNKQFDVLSYDQIQKENLCYTTSTDNLLYSQCSDVTWMKKEESIVYQKYDSQFKAQVFEIPLKNSKSHAGGITNKVTIFSCPSHKYLYNTLEIIT